jgi:hypothetical protein
MGTMLVSKVYLKGCSYFHLKINVKIFTGILLLTSFLKYEARKRISARDAMRNAYFTSLGPAVQDLLDSKYISLMYLHEERLFYQTRPCCTGPIR